MTYPAQSSVPLPLTEVQLGETFAALMRRVYMWMAIGLYLTAGVAFFVAHSSLISIIVRNPILIIGLFLAELALVLVLSAAVNRLAPTTAIALFLLYAILNGITMSVIFLAYTQTDIALAFVTTATLFAAMSFVGYFIRIDLSKLGAFLLMGLIGLVIASIANLFLASTPLMWITTYGGILLFIGLTVFDTQRIKRDLTARLAAGDEAAVARMGVLGALALYLDFINLFLLILRIFGKGRD
ncbi:MAG TPA: Bax inhibitor-1/YccA family protein [Anaerolineales bacterium]|nr:Bax inhibitor-1/YccA family protein [Anaerolineales bacterium]